MRVWQQQAQGGEGTNTAQGGILMTLSVPAAPARAPSPWAVAALPTGPRGGAGGIQGRLWAPLRLVSRPCCCHTLDLLAA